MIGRVISVAISWPLGVALDAAFWVAERIIKPEPRCPECMMALGDRRGHDPSCSYGAVTEGRSTP